MHANPALASRPLSASPSQVLYLRALLAVTVHIAAFLRSWNTTEVGATAHPLPAILQRTIAALHSATGRPTCASRPRAETYAAPFRPPITGALHSALHVLRLSQSSLRLLICPRDASLLRNAASCQPLIFPLTLMFSAAPALPIATS